MTPLTPEHRAKIAESNRRTKNAPPDEVRSCIVCEGSFSCRPHDPKKFCSRACWNNGPRAPRTLESRRRLSEKYRGAGNPFWRGGITPANQRDRNAPEYRVWRKEVYQRDGYRCVDCGVKGSRRNPIVAHHDKPWAGFPDLRFDAANGVTLCNPCHSMRHGRVLPVAA